jgi:antirestriction protein ArdC
MEELVAEIGAAFLCADLGITPEKQASLRSLQPCTTTAGRPRSARPQAAISSQACSPHYQAEKAILQFYSCKL